MTGVQTCALPISGRHPESEGCIPTPPMIPASVIWPHQAYRRVLPTGCRTSIRMDAPVGRCTTDAGGGASRYRLRATPSRSEEHTSELQSLMRISYAVFCL